MTDKPSIKMGIGFADLLLILFIALKLTGQITWSWWWVFSPVWIPLSIILVIGFIIGICFAISEM